jgi:hypothetical protein
LQFLANQFWSKFFPIITAHYESDWGFDSPRLHQTSPRLRLAGQIENKKNKGNPQKIITKAKSARRSFLTAAALAKVVNEGGLFYSF